MDANQRSVKSNPAALLPIGVFLVLYLGCGLLFEYGLKIEAGLLPDPRHRDLPDRPGGRLLPEPEAGLQRQDEGDGRRCGRREHPDHVPGLSGRRSLLRRGVRCWRRGQHGVPVPGLSPQPVRRGRPVPDRLLRVRLHGHLGGHHLCPGPFAVSMSKATGFELVLCIAAVACGAMFGDNLSMISDTTIAAVRTQGCEDEGQVPHELPSSCCPLR